ncbi:MAG: hypothetical protein ACOYI4_01185 [Christensenellales bacterium]
MSKTSKTHWKKLNNPDFLGAYALEPGEDLIVTISRANEEQFTGTGGKKDEGLVIHFKEKDIKPMICNATNAKSITKIAGSPYIEDWQGVKIQLYSAEVSAFGETVDALRVRPFPPKTDEYICAECGAVIEPFKSYTARQMAERARTKFGKQLCMDCATAAAEAKEAEEKEGDVLGDENNED